jgi:hypothetical protein
MGSVHPWVTGGRLQGGAATAAVGHLGEDAAGVGHHNLPQANHQLHLSRDHLHGFDGIRRVSFHPETQSFERTERRHTSSLSILPADVAREALETCEARRVRVKGKEADGPYTVWATGIGLLPREQVEVDRLDRAA